MQVIIIKNPISGANEMIMYLLLDRQRRKEKKEKLGSAFCRRQPTLGYGREET